MRAAAVPTEDYQPRDTKATSAKLLRLEFLRQPAAVRQSTRARIQGILNSEIARAPKKPSELAVRYGAGAYDEPRTGELEALEKWARGDLY